MKMILGGLGGVYAHLKDISYFYIPSKNSKSRILFLKKNKNILNNELPILRAYIFLVQLFFSFIEMLSFSLLALKSIQKTRTVYLILFGSILLSFFIFLIGPDIFFELNSVFYQESSAGLVLRILFFWGYVLAISFHPLVKEVFQWQRAKNLVLEQEQKENRFQYMSRVCEFTYLFILITFMIFYYSLPLPLWGKLVLILVSIPILYEIMNKYESLLYYVIFFFQFFVNKTPTDEQIEIVRKNFLIFEKLKNGVPLEELSQFQLSCEEVF